MERTVTVKEALELLIKEESAKLVKDADIHSEAIKLAEESGIIFIDEIPFPSTTVEPQLLQARGVGERTASTTNVFFF
ncbi:hypothetical protein EfmAA55_11580 [Enterococcus faecium]|nr:hypothetical protein EfmAA55_11580 [Enterococcus faecium]